MSFASDVEKWGKKVNLTNEKVLRIAVLQVGGEIIRGTPVNTGMLRNNWVTSSRGFSDQRRGANKAGSAAVRNLENIVRGQAAGTIYMQNSLPYAVPLEYGTMRGQGPKLRGGYSSQAYGGWVRKAIRRWKNALAKAARQTNPL